MKVIFPSILICIVSTLAVYSQDDYWQQTNGPGAPGQLVRSFAVGDMYLLAGTESDSGIVRSTDGGTTWTPMNEGLSHRYVSAVEINSMGEGFAGTVDGYLFRSPSTGNDELAWIEVEGWTTRSSILSIAFNNSGEIFVGTGGSLFRSTDDGVSWQVINNGISGSGFRALLVASNQIIYTAPTGGTGIYRSTDNGNSWSKVGFSDPNAYCNGITEAMNGYLFAGCGFADVYRSTNNGLTWQNEVIPAFSYLWSIACDTGGTVFAFGQGLFRSSDYGESWEDLRWDGDLFPEGLVMKVSFPGKVYLGTDFDGILRSTDGGQVWEQTYFIVDDIEDLITNSAGDIFARGTWSVYRTTDLGGSWSDLGVSDSKGLGLIRDEEIVAQSYDKIWKSTDNGDNWILLFDAGGNPLWTVVTDGNDFIGTWLVCVGPYCIPGMTRSFNGGLDWEDLNDGSDHPDIAKAYGYGGILIARAGIVLRSTNFGSNWAVSYGITGSAKSIAIRADGLFFAGSTDGLFVSTTGLTWALRSLDAISVNTIAFDRDGHMFAGTSQGVLSSSDSGYTWTSLNSGLTDSIVTSLVSSPDGYLYAGTEFDGVFRSQTPTTDVGNSNDAIPIRFVLSQNYPNPFNPKTDIRFQISDAGWVKLVVYDILGREVASLVNEKLAPGVYSRQWDATAFASGVYFCQLKAGDFVDTKKLVLLR